MGIRDDNLLSRVLGWVVMLTRKLERGSQSQGRQCYKATQRRGGPSALNELSAIYTVNLISAVK